MSRHRVIFVMISACLSFSLWLATLHVPYIYIWTPGTMCVHLAPCHFVARSVRLPGLGTTVDKVLLSGAAVEGQSLGPLGCGRARGYVLSAHGGVEEQQSHVGLLLGLGESLQRDEILLLPLEELGVHVGSLVGSDVT